MLMKECARQSSNLCRSQSWNLTCLLSFYTDWYVTCLLFFYADWYLTLHSRTFKGILYDLRKAKENLPMLLNILYDIEKNANQHIK